MTYVELAAGSPRPPWMAALEAACFGEAWGVLGAHEWALLDEPRGFAVWSVLEAVGEAELLRVAVEPALRGRGSGRALLRASEARLAARGIRALLLEVRASNASARGLYAAEGWIQDGLRRGYYPGGEDAVLYRKTLV